MSIFQENPQALMLALVKAKNPHLADLTESDVSFSDPQEVTNVIDRDSSALMTRLSDVTTIAPEARVYYNRINLGDWLSPYVADSYSLDTLHQLMDINNSDAVNALIDDIERRFALNWTALVTGEHFLPDGPGTTMTEITMREPSLLFNGSLTIEHAAEISSSGPFAYHVNPYPQIMYAESSDGCGYTDEVGGVLLGDGGCSFWPRLIDPMGSGEEEDFAFSNMTFVGGRVYSYIPTGENEQVSVQIGNSTGFRLSGSESRHEATLSVRSLGEVTASFACDTRFLLDGSRAYMAEVTFSDGERLIYTQVYLQRQMYGAIA